MYQCVECREVNQHVEPTFHPYGKGVCRCGCKTFIKIRPDPPLEGPGQARGSDPPTSHDAAKLVRPGSARRALLLAHLSHPGGLTDEEAAEIAGLALTSEYATRCSELKRADLLRDTQMERQGASGMRRMVRVITENGVALAQSIL